MATKFNQKRRNAKSGLNQRGFRFTNFCLTDNVKINKFIFILFSSNV